MISSIKFGLGLLRLYSGVVWSQIFLNKDDHNKLYQGKKIPLQVTHSCTWKCNFSCIHCQAENDLKREDVKTEPILKMIDEIKKAGAVKIGFTGGEPLVRKDIPEILDKCKKNSLITTMVSNGLLVPRYINELKKLDLLFLSMDGDKDAHEYVRGKNSWEVLLRAMELARENNIPVVALTTLAAFNIDCLQEMSRIILEQKVHWMVSIIQTGFTGRNEQKISRGQIQRSVDILAKNKFQRTSRKYLKFIQDDKPPKICFAGIGYGIISPDLTLYPCFPAQFDPTYKGVSLKDMTFKEAFDELPLYRRTCDTCKLACHIEANYLYFFNLNSIINSYRLTKTIV